MADDAAALKRQRVSAEEEVARLLKLLESAVVAKSKKDVEASIGSLRAAFKTLEALQAQCEETLAGKDTVNAFKAKLELAAPKVRESIELAEQFLSKHSNVEIKCQAKGLKDLLAVLEQAECLSESDYESSPSVDPV